MGLYEDIIAKQAEAKELYDKITITQRELDTMIGDLRKDEGIKLYPKIGDLYYFVDVDGEVRYAVWHDSGVERGLFDSGSCFFDEESAIFDREYRQISGIFRRYRGIRKAKGEHEVGEWHICVLHSNSGESLPDVEVAEVSWPTSIADVFFPTKELADKARKEVGDDRLIKYWFNPEVCKNDHNNRTA